MFKEKVKARTDRRTTDNGPSHKLAGLRPVELKINSLPKGEILDWSKLKANADDKIKVLKINIFVFHTVEHTVGKGENAGYQSFLLFQQCFQKPFFRVVKSQDCEVKSLPFTKRQHFRLVHIELLSIWTSLKFFRLVKC